MSPRRADLMTLTDAKVRAMRPAPTAQWITDGQRDEDGAMVPTGLLLVVAPSGRKAWAIRTTTTAGARRFHSFATFPTMGVKAARRRAAKLLEDIADGTFDPHAARLRRRAEKAPAPAPDAPLTVAQWAERYLTIHAARLKPSTVALYRDLMRLHIGPAFGGEAIATLTAAPIRALSMRMKDTPTAANQSVRLCSTLLREAMREQLRPDNPAQFVARYRERPRDRYLSDAEVSALWQALDRADREGLPPSVKQRRPPGKPERQKHRPKSIPVYAANPHATGAIRLALLTGMRRGEVLTLEWEFVDLQRKVVLLPDSKTGRSPRQLSNAAVELLAGLPKIVGSRWVFPSPVNVRRPLSPPTRVWEKVRQEAGLEDVRGHDLRHTHASLAIQAGATLAEVQRQLGHKDQRTTARYAHMADAGARRAADLAADAITRATTTPTTTVTPIKRRAK